MFKSRHAGVIVGGAAMLIVSACADLDVTNPNAPDIDRALASPQDVQNLAVSTMNSWYLLATDIYPWTMLTVTADVGTANFGNFGMRFNNLEPRANYDNNSAGGDRDATQEPWDNGYSTLGAANDMLRATDGGVVLNGGAAATAKYRALAQFTQAATLSHLGMLFDQAFVVDEKTSPDETPTLKPYKEVLAAAMTKWDATIAALQGKNETYEATTLPLTAGALNSDILRRMANTMAARTLALGARNATENTATDWAKVKAYAEKGISSGTPIDISVVGDDCNNWCSLYLFYADEPTWIRVDQRVINIMNPTYPAKFNGTIVPAGTAPDDRYLKDFQFHNAVIGDPARGIFMQSPWSHQRYRYHARTSATSGEGPAPYLLAAENDLLLAEALVRTNTNLAQAATLINKTRVTRGKLAPADASEGAATLLDYIFYERIIELYGTSANEFFDVRRFEKGQPGMFRHIPIPARELETLALKIYTFGGVGKPVMSIMTGDGSLVGLHFGKTRVSGMNALPEQ